MSGSLFERVCGVGCQDRDIASLTHVNTILLEPLHHRFDLVRSSPEGIYELASLTAKATGREEFCTASLGGFVGRSSGVSSNLRVARALKCL
jgi:hypothetical protein